MIIILFFTFGKSNMNDSSIKAICKALQLNYSNTYNKYCKNDAYLCNTKLTSSIEDISRKITKVGECAIMAGSIFNAISEIVKKNCSKTKVSS